MVEGAGKDDDLSQREGRGSLRLQGASRCAPTGRRFGGRRTGGEVEDHGEAIIAAGGQSAKGVVAGPRNLTTEPVAGGCQLSAVSYQREAGTVGGRGTEQEILLNGSRRRALGMGV